MSTVYQLYSTLLNDRLTTFLEKENLVVEKQNGFGKGRACIDHIYTVCTIVRNRLQENTPTFVCCCKYVVVFKTLLT